MRTKLFRTTVTGSYPRPQQPGDTLKKPTLTREQADEIIRWAVTEQVAAGLTVVTDGEGRRENMYYFFQKRLDGVTFDEMEYRKYGPLGSASRSPKSWDRSRIRGSIWRTTGKLRVPRRRPTLRSSSRARPSHAGEILE
jgi:methionine synthase II (cobalamin-independent)